MSHITHANTSWAVPSFIYRPLIQRNHTTTSHARWMMHSCTYSSLLVSPSLCCRRMVGSCYEKCIDKKFKDGDLNVGENSCVDRCASKYWQCVGIVGQMLGAADQVAGQGQQQQ